MDLKPPIRKVLDSYREGAEKELLDQLLPLLNDEVQRQVRLITIGTVKVEKRTLEDLIGYIAELKDNYLLLPDKTFADDTKVAELRQIEYKLREILHDNKNF